MCSSDLLAGQSLLTRDRQGDGLPQLDKIRLHVGDGLIEDLGRVLHAADGSVGVGTNQPAQPIKETHDLASDALRLARFLQQFCLGSTHGGCT